MDANDTASRTSSPLLRFSTSPLLHFSASRTDGRRSSPPEHRSAKQRTSALRGSGVELCPGRRVHSKEVFNILKLAKEKNFNFNKILFKRAFMEKIYKKFFKKIFFFALPFLFFL
jgi:hypothetical protein